VGRQTVDTLSLIFAEPLSSITAMSCFKFSLVKPLCLWMVLTLKCSSTEVIPSLLCAPDKENQILNGYGGKKKEKE